jgi:RNA polymerase sigma-70 factor (ECF subfamily)
LALRQPQRAALVDAALGDAALGDAALGDDVDLGRDRGLVERCQAGDAAAFGNLYARYYERLLRFCLRRLSDRHEAEDAAQEAFARAWKALPRFAGERRFYPWLTVIAGNICTDMLRRRARSTPHDDMELTAQRAGGVVGAVGVVGGVGGVGEDTFEERVLAAVDAELVTRAFDRLSERHRRVLAMREGSGWTYQEIADHEGVAVGTIESLLWRARQALKREFAFVSDSKEALAGFLVATGALLRRTVFRAVHRAASARSQDSGGTGGGLRSAVAGVAVASATVAGAFIAPHALSGSGTASGAPGSGGGSSVALADPALDLGLPVPTAAKTTVPMPALSDTGQTSSTGGSDSAGGPGAGGSGSPAAVAGRDTPGSGGNGTTVSAGNGTIAGTSPVGGVVNQTGQGLDGVTQGLGDTVTTVVGGLNNAVNGVTNGVGNTVNGLAGGLSNATGNLTSGLSNTVGGTVGGVVGGLSTSVSGLLGGNGTGTGAAPTPPPAPSTTTTTTTAPGLLGGVGNLLGGN